MPEPAVISEIGERIIAVTELDRYIFGDELLLPIYGAPWCRVQLATEQQVGLFARRALPGARGADGDSSGRPPRA